MRIYVMLARLGDLLNILPMAFEDNENGSRSTIVTCAEYAPHLEGCSYIDVKVFDGKSHELVKAEKYAKSLGGEVVVTQTAGNTDELNKVGQTKRYTDSWAKEAWFLADRIKSFQLQKPLVFDRRSPEREAELINSYLGAYKGKSPGKLSTRRTYYLVASKGHSSPFPYSDLLFELIRGRFGTGVGHAKHVIDLSTLKAHRIYDLLPFYEAAECLIAIDSAPLHLAMACPKLPVVALVNDKPTYWHGSPWRKNHIAHIRYSDFPERCIEMLDAISRIRKPGSQFVQGVPGYKLVHVYSAYQLNGEHEYASQTWMDEYVTGRWIHTPIERGAMGRDSKIALKDPMRLPYLKDVIRAACMRAEDDDVIVLSRDHTCAVHGLTDQLTRENPWFAYRQFREPETHHPAVDLFAFTKKFWTQMRDQVPDLILGKDRNWDSVLLHIFKSAGAKELRGWTYRKEKET